MLKIRTMKRLLRHKETIILLIAMLLFRNAYGQQQYPVTINTSIIPPMSPYFNQMLAQSGGRLNVQVMNNSVSGASVQIKIVGKVECLSPTPFSISLNPSFVPQRPITLGPMQSMVLTNDLLQQTFGNLSEHNILFDGITLAGLREGVNYKLPEGMYRLCFVAYSYDPSGQGRPLSDPNLGCTTFNVCYKAAAPQITQPVNGMAVQDGISTIPPGSPVIFAWTPPSATCGILPGGITYDLEIKEVLSGQTPTDAINNPYVFQKKALPSSTFVLDTNLYKHILQTGRQYVMRVKANGMPASGMVEIDNQGFSRPETFRYGTQQQPVDKPDNQPQSVSLAAGDCGIKPPKNTTPYNGKTEDLNEQDLQIGDFKLHPHKIEKKGSTYSGDGYVMWQPFGHGIALRVTFDSIRINTDKQVYEGLVNTTTEPTTYTWSPLTKADNLLQAVGMADNKTISDLRTHINSSAKMIDQILGNEPVDMPLGWTQEVDGTPLTLAIMGINFSPRGTNMNLVASVDIPEANGWLSMAGTNFCIAPTGVVVSNGTLYLPKDRDMNLFSGADNINFKFKGCSAADTAKGTYLNIKNGKLDRIMARAELSFPQSVLVPEDDKGTIKAGSVTAAIQFSFVNWDDWMATVNMPRFQIKGVKGLSFQPSAVFYDHSVKSNPAGFKYPAQAGSQPGNAFEGLYMQQLKVMLPEDFKTFNQGTERTSFTTSGLIIDDKGLSADISGNNVIDISTGNLGGWAFSLSKINVVMVQSTFKSGTISGQFLLPVSSTRLDYSGDLHVDKGSDSLQYEFVINPADKMQFELWKADVTLSKNSSFEVKRDNYGTAVSAILNGGIGFNLSDAPAIRFDALQFDSLGIANRDMKTKKEKFWISAGTWSFAGMSSKKSGAFVPFQGEEAPYYALGGPHAGFTEDDMKEPPAGDNSQGKVSGFPVAINGAIEPFMDVTDMSSLKAGIRLKLKVGLGFGDQSVVSAATRLSIYGSLDAHLQNMAPKIALKGQVDLDSLQLNGLVGPIKVEGMLTFYRHDPVYGDGFKGHVFADFKLAALDATAQFGNVNNYNYWYIDGSVAFGKVVPLVAMVGLNGFGGGAYYNMVMQNDPPDPAHLEPKSKANDLTPGASISGIKFVPKSGGFGLRATVLLALVDPAGPKAMNAKVTLTAELLNGAFNSVALTGDVAVLTNPPGNDNAIVTGHVDISYNIPNKDFNFTGKLKGKFTTVKLDVPFGIHSGQDGWYMKVGDPAPGKERVTFTLLDIPNNGLYEAVVKGSAYVEMGSLVNPQLPDLPDEITRLGVQRSPQIVSLLQALNDAPGSGFAFGARVDGRLHFQLAFLYADGNAIVGFDLALKKFDQDFSCGGHSAGWNNWYATGELYAYLGIDIGIELDVWFYHGKCPLLKTAVAAALTGGLPNPTWLDGYVQVDQEVLGGLVSVHTSAHFTIGDKCYPTPDPLRDIRIISDCGPGTKADVGAYPYAVSNVGFDENLDIHIPPTDKMPYGEIRTFRFYVNSFTLRNRKTGQLVSSYTPQYENGNTSVILKRGEILEGHTQYDVYLSCSIKQFYNNRWGDPYNDKEGSYKPMQQDTTFSFTTGEQPAALMENRISFVYPIKNQRYVLKNEFGGKGRITMEMWQRNLFPDNGKGLGATRTYNAYFIPKGGVDTVKTTFEVSEDGRNIDFPLPPALKNNTVYRLELWSVPKSSLLEKQQLAFNRGQPAGAVSTTTQMNKRNVSWVDVNIRETRATNVALLEQPHPVYTLYFRTSQFNTFTDKINAFGGWNARASGNQIRITNDMITSEQFDAYEIKGFSAPNGTAYPPLFSPVINWDSQQQNDKSFDGIYGNVFGLAAWQVYFNLGAPEVRDWLRPVKTLDCSQFPSDAPLSGEESGEINARFLVHNSAIQISKPAGNAGSYMQVNAGGYTMQLPAVANAMYQTSTGIRFNTMVWNREQFLREDFNLLKSFGYSAWLQASVIQQQLGTQARNELESWTNNMSFPTNSLGGSITMPWNRFYYLYSNTAAMNMINALKNMSYTTYPKGSRNLLFRYNAGLMKGSSVVKPFTL